MTARAVFADLLAAYRKDAGWTLAQAAEQFTMSKSLYQKIESCDRKPQREMATEADKLYHTRHAFTRVYKDILTEPHPPWFGPRVELEDRATVITIWEQRGVPGLLQTEAYAHAAVNACRPYDGPEIREQVVKDRLERQEILVREHPPKLWVVVGEGVIRQRVGGREVMGGQLTHLLEMSKSSRAVIQVLPFSAEDAPGLNGPAALFEFESAPSVAYLEGWESGQIVEDPAEVANIATALSMLKGCALSPRDSLQLIAEIRG